MLSLSVAPDLFYWNASLLCVAARWRQVMNRDDQTEWNRGNERHTCKDLTDKELKRRSPVKSTDFVSESHVERNLLGENSRFYLLHRLRRFPADGLINLIKKGAADSVTPYITERSAAPWCGSDPSSHCGGEKSAAATWRRSVSNERNTSRQQEALAWRRGEQRPLHFQLQYRSAWRLFSAQHAHTPTGF